LSSGGFGAWVLGGERLGEVVDVLRREGLARNGCFSLFDGVDCVSIPQFSNTLTVWGHRVAVAEALKDGGVGRCWSVDGVLSWLCAFRLCGFGWVLGWCGGFLGLVFLVGFGMLGSLRGVFTPARNGRHQGVREPHPYFALWECGNCFPTPPDPRISPLEPARRQGQRVWWCRPVHALLPHPAAVDA
jgi:hypothetical protein